MFAVHAYESMRAAARAKKLTKQDELETPEVVHPLIRTHEDTGAKAFYFNPNRTDRLVNMERAESDAMLDWVTTPSHRTNIAMITNGALAIF